MESFWLAAGTALWLGILTSISPCPLATNIVAVSFLVRRVNHPWRVLLAGALYTAGRMLTYVTVSAIVVWSLLSASQVSHALQHWLNLVLGPLLILTGLIMLGWISLPVFSSRRQSRLTERAEGLGLWGAAVLGMIFALTFCPVSAALFFGSLIPIGVQADSTFLIPSIYAVGTALPVLFFAVLLALGVKSLSGVFNWLTRAERWARWATAVIFILIGLHLSLIHLAGVDVTESLWKT